MTQMLTHKPMKVKLQQLTSFTSGSPFLTNPGSMQATKKYSTKDSNVARIYKTGSAAQPSSMSLLNTVAQ